MCLHQPSSIDIQEAPALPMNPKLHAFSVFPGLPLELQHEIWEIFAADEAEEAPSCLQRMRPIPHSNTMHISPRTLEVRVVNQPHTLPLSLQICANSRHAAAKFYTPWLKEDGGHVFVNKAKDVFWFVSERPAFCNYLFLLRDIICGGEDPIPDDINILSYRRFYDQMKGIRHIAFDNDTFTHVTTFPLSVPHDKDKLGQWFGFLGKIRQMDIVFKSGKLPEMQPLKLRVVPLQHLVDESLILGKHTEWLFERARAANKSMLLPQWQYAVAVPVGGTQSRDEDAWVNIKRREYLSGVRMP